MRPGAAIRPDGGPRIRHLVRHPHAERSSRARPRSSVRQLRHRRRHVAFRPMPRRPGDARLAAARMVSFRADQRCSGKVLDRQRRADPHRSRRPPLPRRRRHRRGSHPAAAAHSSSLSRDSQHGETGGARRRAVRAIVHRDGPQLSGSERVPSREASSCAAAPGSAAPPRRASSCGGCGSPDRTDRCRRSSRT